MAHTYDMLSIVCTLIQLDFLLIAQGGCFGTRAVGDQFSFRDQFWKAHARPEVRFPRKTQLQVNI